MADPKLQLKELFANAWKDDVAGKKLMADLTSDDQARVSAAFKTVGIELEGTEMKVFQGTKKDRCTVIPPKQWVLTGNDEDAAGKCYGPFCFCGPY